MPTATTAPTDPEGAPVNVLRLTLILSSLTAFAPFATDMYLASFPLLAESFQTDIGSVQLGLSVFFLGLAVGQLVYGPQTGRHWQLPLTPSPRFAPMMGGCRHDASGFNDGRAAGSAS